MKTYKAELKILSEQLIELSYNSKNKTDLVKIAVNLDMIGDRIEDEKATLGKLFEGIRDSLKGVIE